MMTQTQELKAELPSMLFHPEYYGPSSHEPIVIQQMYEFQHQTMPKVPCQVHHDQMITHYCKICSKALCDKCCKIHDAEHKKEKRTPSNIVPLELCLTEAYQELAYIANQFAGAYDRVLHLSDDGIVSDLTQQTSLLTNPLNLIESAKQQVHAIVENYFNSLITFFKSRVPYAMPGNTQSAEQLRTEIRTQWTALVKQLELLNRENGCIQELIHVSQGEPEKAKQEYQNIYQQIDDLQRANYHRVPGPDIPQLFVDPSYLQDFLATLERYTYFQSPEYTRNRLPPPPPPPQPRYEMPPIYSLPPPTTYHSSYNAPYYDMPPYRDYSPSKEIIVTTPPPQIVETEPYIYEQPYERNRRYSQPKQRRQKSQKKQKTMVVHHVQHQNQFAPPPQPISYAQSTPISYVQAPQATVSYVQPTTVSFAQAPAVVGQTLTVPQQGMITNNSVLSTNKNNNNVGNITRLSNANYK